MNRTDVVVGVDGSDASRAALRWAEREAQRRHALLRIVAAYRPQWAADQLAAGADATAELLTATERMITDLVAESRERTPGVVVTGLVAAGGPGPVLAAAARNAALVVVGSRGHGGLASVLLGATTLHLATHAPVPVVVVHGSGEPRTGPVVVGTDCSSTADTAIGAAFEAAASRGCPVTAVHSYRVPAPSRTPGAAQHDHDPDALYTDAHAVLADTIAPWWGKYPEVDTDLVVTPADPVDVLVSRSEEARLVVVGTRGHGGVAGFLLGSVGQKLLRRARCPVLISRP